MRKKKDLPLVILKALEPYVNLKGDKFEVVEPKESLLKVIDKDSESQFHFTIHKYQRNTSNGKFQFLMTRMPKDNNDNGNMQSWLEIDSLKSQFEYWLKLLDEYESVNSFFDDPIIISFSKEFYEEFEIIEEDAETNPLNTKQILLLDNYLETIDKKLLEFKTEHNSQDIEEIKEDILILRENLTNKSKKWVVKRLTSIWAKIAKQGTKFIKEFLSESKKELIKQGVKGLIEYVKENGIDLLN
ncbi:hypothetical protein [Flavobacterium sp. U410]|jgi:hypothetical protein